MYLALSVARTMAGCEVILAALDRQLQCPQLGAHRRRIDKVNAVQAKLARGFDVLLPVVDEYRTTELAKREYWKAHPPTGWRRFLPVTMQVPPEPVDDFVAVLLGRRYIEKAGAAER